MLDLCYSELAFANLVAERPRKADSTVKGFKMVNSTMFITISPNPTTRVPCIIRQTNGKPKKTFRPYGMLSQRLQFEYCIKCFKQDHMEWYSEEVSLIGVPELNKRGDVHLHILVNEPTIRTETALQIYRRDVLMSPRTQENIVKGKYKATDYMNNIVFLTVTTKEITDYFMKQQSEMLEHFKNFFSN